MTADLPWYMVALLSAVVGLVAFAARRVGRLAGGVGDRPVGGDEGGCEGIGGRAVVIVTIHWSELRG